MPIGKIDSKSFQIAQQANAFLRLSVSGGTGGGSSSPSSGRDTVDGAERAAAELWRDLGGSQDAVSRCVSGVCARQGVSVCVQQVVITCSAV